jgi:anti-anti-sigma factor
VSGPERTTLWIEHTLGLGGAKLVTTLRPGIEIEHGQPVIRLMGELDLATAPDLAEDLQRASGIVCIDLSAVPFMDSMGAHVMVNAARQVQDSGCVVLHGVQPAVRRVFDTLGIDGVVSNLHVLDGHAPSGTE